MNEESEEMTKAIRSSKSRPTMNEHKSPRGETADLSKIPIEIIFEILSRLPAKTLLQLRCVSKLCCFLVGDPSFINLHLNRSINGRLDGYALFVSTYSKSTSEVEFLSVSPSGGPTTHLLTIIESRPDYAVPEHVNGLLFFRRVNNFYCHYNYSCVFNPSTRELLELPQRPSNKKLQKDDAHICDLFGYDPSTNDYKILNIRLIDLPNDPISECAIFSFSSYSWRKIQAVFPFDVTGKSWVFWFKDSVCVNGVIHWTIDGYNVIAAFDLSEEKFSLIPFPPGAIPSETICSGGHVVANAAKVPYVIQINGLLAVVCVEHVVERNTMELWILDDYQNQVWVKESINFWNSWEVLGSPYPLGTIHTGELMLTPIQTGKNLVFVLFYDIKKRSFRFVEINLVPEPSSDDVEVRDVGHYVESILSLRNF